MDRKLTIINKCLLGCLVKCGHKERASNIYHGILEYIRARIPKDHHPLMLILHVVENARPSVNLWSKKVGGSSYKIPYLISEKKGFSMVIHALVHEARLRSERGFDAKLGALFIECARGRNVSIIKKKEEIHKIALNNRAFLKHK